MSETNKYKVNPAASVPAPAAPYRKFAADAAVEKQEFDTVWETDIWSKDLKPGQVQTHELAVNAPDLRLLHVSQGTWTLTVSIYMSFGRNGLQTNMRACVYCCFAAAAL